MTDRNCWSTPDYLFMIYHERWRFTVDACALPSNTKLPRYWAPLAYLGSVQDAGHAIPAGFDGLAQDWTGERVWCNPPYGRGLIEPWVDKALQRQAEVAVLLLPSRTDTRWFQRLHRQAQVQFLAHRVRFVPPPGVRESSPTEASIVAVVTR